MLLFLLILIIVISLTSKKIIFYLCVYQKVMDGKIPPVKIPPVKRYKKSKVDDKLVLDNNGNVISDIHGDVYRDKRGYVVVGKDGLIRDALGYIVKDARDIPFKAKLDFAPTESKKSSLKKKRILDDEVVLNTDGTVDYDKYGVVKRTKNGVVVLAPNGVFRDSKGFVLKNDKGFVLKKPDYIKYNSLEDIEALPVKKSSAKTAKKVSLKNYTEDDKTILNLLLNIKVPEGYYTDSGLKLKDLIDPARNLVPNFTKVFLSLYPSFFLSSSATTNIVINVLALILSDAIPYPELKKKLTDEILSVLSSARKQANFIFAKFVLTNFKNNPETVKILKSIPYLKIIPIILAAFTIYGGSSKNLSNSLQSGISLFLAESSVPLRLNKKEVVTRSYLETEKIISPGDTTINLKKLGLFYKTSAIDNKDQGISIEKILTFFSGASLSIELNVYNPYTETKSAAVTQIKLIKTDSDVKAIILETQNTANRTIKKLNENINHFEDILADIATVAKIKKETAYNTNIEKFLQEKKARNISYTVQEMTSIEMEVVKITEKINSLVGSLKRISADSELSSYNTLQFSTKVLNILNFLKTRQVALTLLLKDISKSTKENANSIKIITDNTVTEVNGSLPKIKELLDKTNINALYNKISNFNIEPLNIL
jgi:hypothetical protein